MSRSPRKDKKTVHWHACTEPSCRIKYEDTCETPPVDGLCTRCRGYLPWWELIESAMWSECCFANTRPVTKQEIKSYSLAGSQTWFRCKTCARMQVYEPGSSTDP